MEAEKKLALAPGEGPVGIILGPSRELQRQTSFVVEHFAKALSSKPGAPELRTLLCIGGENKREQQSVIQQRGVHTVVATPGRTARIISPTRSSPITAAADVQA